MIKFNELRITPNNENLIIDVCIEDAEYFDNVVLDSIIIDTQDTFTVGGPSTRAVFTYNISKHTEELVYSLPNNTGNFPVQDESDLNYCFIEGESSNKFARLVLNSEDLGVEISENIFFVYAIASGEPAEDTPHDLRDSKIVGIAINTYPIYKQSMKYIRELDDSCNIPRNFIDYILKIKSLDLAIKTGNYQEIIKYWNKFFKAVNANVKPYSICKCYGGDY